MTPQDHLLLIALIGRQNAKFNTLFNALISSGVLHADDLEARRQYLLQENPQELELCLQQAWESHQSTAASLGITTGLEHGPYLPKK